jgi:hypothetical protein
VPFEVPTPRVSGGDRPEPFDENDERRVLSDILRNMSRLKKLCFFPSELIMEEEMEGAKAYHNPKAKERALYGEQNEYYRHVTYCLEKLREKRLVKKEEKVDETDNTKYTVYCKTNLLEEVRTQIMGVQLSDIDKILQEYKRKQTATS